MIGLDTTAIIDFFKGDEKLKQALDTLQEPLATNTLNYLELQFGLDPNNKEHNKEARYYDEFFENTHHLPLDRAAARKAATIHSTLKKRGSQIGKFDVTIAACYLDKGITRILTKNTKHFSKIPDVETITY